MRWLILQDGSACRAGRVVSIYVESDGVGWSVMAEMIGWDVPAILGAAKSKQAALALIDRIVRWEQPVFDVRRH